MSKHLDIRERILIEDGLNAGLSLSAIARKLERHPTTITQEIRGHLKIEHKGAHGAAFNDCANRFGCTLTNVCSNPQCPPEKKCFTCRACRSACAYFEKQECEKLASPPYVCNGCSARGCTLTKHIYDARFAQSEYETVLRESRQDPRVSPQELASINKIVRQGVVGQGQSLYAVWLANQDQIMHSLSWLYRMVSNDTLSVKPIDLIQTVQRKPRNSGSKARTYKVDKECLKNRRYEDYLERQKNAPFYPSTQMDTVIGRVGGQCILTLHIVETHFTFAFLLPRHDARSVRDAFNRFYRDLTARVFREMFPVILTDNGSEFSDPVSLEFSPRGVKRTSIYYCHPFSSFEKGAIEKNHELLRRILPKGTSFDDMTQDELNCIMSHINSYPRRKKDHKTPWDLMETLFPAAIPRLLKMGLQHVSPTEVHMKPDFLTLLRQSRLTSNSINR